MIKSVILVSIITIILIYWIHLNMHKVEGFADNEIKPNKESAVLTWMKDLQTKNEPQIYSESYQLSSISRRLLSSSIWYYNRRYNRF